MKIALAVDCFHPYGTSAGRWSWQLAERLQRRGCQVHVVAERVFDQVPAQVETHPLASGLSAVRRAAAADRLLGSLDPDLVHDMGLGCSADIFTPHDGSPWEESPAEPASGFWLPRPIGRLVGRLFGGASAGAAAAPSVVPSDCQILAPSKIAAEKCRTLYDVVPERLRLVPPGVDIKRFSPHLRTLRRDATRRKLGVGQGELLLLWAGDDFQREGLRTILRAMKRLGGSGVSPRLAVVGETSRKGCEKFAAGLGLSDRIAWIARCDLSPHLAAADIFVLPVVYDAFSVVILEAAACSLPCIISAADGAAELMEDGADSFQIRSPRDDAELAERIVELADPARRERMGRAARRTAMAWTAEASADRTLEIYREILTSRGGSGGAESREIVPLTRRKPSGPPTGRRAA